MDIVCDGNENNLYNLELKKYTYLPMINERWYDEWLVATFSFALLYLVVFNECCDRNFLSEKKQINL